MLAASTLTDIELPLDGSKKTAAKRFFFVLARALVAQ
jgi:hypothetical protein